MEATEFDDDKPRLKRTDVQALKILASWVAGHDGVDPSTGATIDREFVVVDARASPQKRGPDVVIPGPAYQLGSGVGPL